MHSMECLFRLPDSDPRVFNFTCQIVEKNTATECLHSHDFIKIMRVCEGSAIWQLGHNTYEIHKGDVIILNSTELRRVVKVPGPYDFVFEWLQFSPLTVYPDITTVGIFYRRPQGFNNIIHSDAPHFETIELYFKLLSENVRRNEPLREQAVISNLRSLLIEVTRCYCEMLNVDLINDKMLTAQNYLIITDTIEYINGHYSEPMSETQLADRVHLNRSYFSRMFISYCGIGFRAYLRRIRLNAVISLLEQQGEHTNVLDAAFSCGFTSAAGFYKTLHELTGTGSVRSYMS